jgi:hypothetical protein
MRSFWKEIGTKRVTAGAAMAALVCLLAPACRVTAQGRFPHQKTVESFVAASNFAIADFDGDRKPDVATVEMKTGESSGDVQYSIRFELTSGDTRVFGVTAPVGGLQIVAKDVNGDNALDLLVSTAWQHKQIAVLLNDGHGNFTMAAPEAFPASIWAVDNQWSSGSMPGSDGVVMLRCQNDPDAQPQQSAGASANRQVGRTQQTVSSHWSRLLLFALQGRAPPAFLQA